MTSTYLKRITLSYPTHIISIANLIGISVETLMIDSECSFKKEFVE